MSENIDIIIVPELPTPPEFPKPLSQTIWVVGSSCFFLVPAIYAFSNAHYFKLLHLYASLSVCTTVCSVNHWRKAEDGLRRKIDKAAAWTAFVAYVITGFIYLPIPLSITTVSTIAISFKISDNLSLKHHPVWPFIHAFFHLSVSVTKMFIIYYINKKA